MNGEPLDLQVRRWLKACGGALLTLVLLVLIGRFAGLPGLVTVVPGGAPMAFPTVVGFFLGGIAFIAHGCNRAGVGHVAAGAMVVLGAGTLLTYGLAEPLGLRQFVYNAANPVLSRGVGFDGRMSPNTAASFVLLGVSLLLLGMRKLRPRLVAPGIALLLAIALLASISYLTGLRFAAEWWRYTAMAVHTSTAFLFAAVVLLAWLSRRMAAAVEAVARTLPFFVIAGSAVLVLGSVVVMSNDQRLVATHYMNRTLEVEVGIDRFIASVARLESSVRAFGLTGDERYLERIAVHRGSVSDATEALVQLTADTPAQNVRALALRPLIAQKFAENEAQTRARQERGTAAAAGVLRAEPPELMAGLRAATDGLQAEQHRVLAQRRAEIAKSETRLQWVLICGVWVTVGVISAALTLVHRAQRDLRAANDQLEGRVRARTAEFEASTARLRESEQRLQFLADNMPQLVWTTRPDGPAETFNAGWLEYSGLNAAESLYSGWGRVLYADDRDACFAEWNEMLRTGRSGGGEYRLKRAADGAYRWHLWRAHPQHDPAGRIVRWVGTSTDIHDQKLAEERLEQRVAERTAELTSSEERFRHAFHFAGTGMAIVGLDGRWLRVNRSVCEIVGYSETDLLQKTFQDITHPADLAADLEHVRELVDGARRYYQMEKRYFHREGHVVWVRLTVSLVHAAAGEPLHFVAQIEDITERKRLEENLAGARDQALEASRLKSEFLAMMSHEIRTPMNGVIGMTSLLRDTSLTSTQADYVRTIDSCGESLLTLINDILDYSKIEAGRIDLELAPFDVRRCAIDALDLFVGRVQGKSLTLRHEVGAGVPAVVMGDANRLRQILVNLLGNAVKFTETGEVVLTIQTELAGEGRPHHRLSFSIRDTGIGIPPEGINRLFKSFSQVDASTTRRFGGTGLGLAISKRLAEMMGGTMGVESRPGEGSTFFFTVVVEPVAEAAPAGEVAASVPSHDGTLGQRCPLRLLIAEDNPVNKRVATLLLQRLGYGAMTAANGQEALAATEAADFDVILMDVEMPELDGCEATRRIRSRGGSAARPWIIALTAGAMQSDRERALVAGMNDFLTKPVRTEALSVALARAHASLNVKA